MVLQIQGINNQDQEATFNVEKLQQHKIELEVT